VHEGCLPTSIATLWAWFILGQYGLVTDVLHGWAMFKQQGIKNGELQASFGQLVPLFFCILPFLSMFQTFHGMFNSYECSRKLANTYMQDMKVEHEDESSVEDANEMMMSGGLSLLPSSEISLNNLSTPVPGATSSGASMDADIADEPISNLSRRITAHVSMETLSNKFTVTWKLQILYV